MTGYGKASAEFQGKKIIAEAKSLNSKALDLVTRIAPIYREKEMEVRAFLSQSLERGKVEFSLWTEQSEYTEARGSMHKRPRRGAGFGRLCSAGNYMCANRNSGTRIDA